jgi:hypothetical protein
MTVLAFALIPTDQRSVMRERANRATGDAATSSYRGAPARLEWGVVLFSTTFVVGLYLDGWAHVHGRPETFFTPWHGVLYAGFFGAAAVLGWSALAARRRGASWRRSLPTGYGLALVGVGLFLTAGAADLLWHSVFGIEADIEALYSPPHLVLATGGALIVTGPLRAAWSSPTSSALVLWRAVLSLLLLLALFSFFTGEFHPLMHPWAAARFRPIEIGPGALGLPSMPAGGVGTQDFTLTLGVSSILFQTIVLMGMLLMVIRRWGAALPVGWLTFLLTMNSLGLAIFHSTPWTVPVAASTGVLADLLYQRLKPEIERPAPIRIFAASVPVILYSAYFAGLAATGGTWWRVHVWAGSIFMAGVVGWLVSYLVVPPDSRGAAPVGPTARAISADSISATRPLNSL